MENNLYYQPTIEEFHVGFEYRNINNLDIGYICKDMLPKEYSEGLIRVKFLDKSDIESLGWEFVEDTCPGFDGRWYDVFKKGAFSLTFGEELQIRANSKIDSYGLLDNRQPGKVIFTGIIKNKSELKKLMQQLNIK